ncbi:hypothetical protein Tco_0624464 [Tanacetum coccineum]|uniref:Peptidase S74 domain-containing protein n=1 Tax=Tanacetum coccineum TaxID=301880 RepID=A0ABQ4WE35_9ASTR
MILSLGQPSYGDRTVPSLWAGGIIRYSFDASSILIRRNPLMSDHSLTKFNRSTSGWGHLAMRRRYPMAYCTALSLNSKAYLLSVLIDYHNLRELRILVSSGKYTLRDRGINARVVVEGYDPRMEHREREGAVEATYETFRDLVQRMVGVESAVIALTEKIVKLERDNTRLRGTVSVES